MLQKDVGFGGRLLAVILSAPVALLLLLAFLAIATREWGRGFAGLWLVGLVLASVLSGWAIADLRVPGKSRLHWIAVGIVTLMGVLIYLPMLPAIARGGASSPIVMTLGGLAAGSLIGQLLRKRAAKTGPAAKVETTGASGTGEETTTPRGG